MNIYHYMPLISSFFLLVLALFLLYHRNTSKSITGLAIFCGVAAVWQFDMFILYSSQPIEVLYTLRRIPRTFTMMLAPAYLNFIYTFLTRKRNDPIFFLAFAIGTCYAVFRFFHYTGESYYVMDQFYYPAKTVLLYSWYIYTITVIVYGFFLMLAKYNLSDNPRERLQFKFFYIAWLVIIIFNMDCFLLSFAVKIYHTTSVSIIVFVMILAYSILKYSLIDMERLIKRVSYFVMSMLLVVLPLIVLSDYVINHIMKLAGAQSMVIDAVVWSVVLFYFDRIKDFLQRMTDKIFFLPEYNYDDIVNNINYQFHEIDNVENLAVVAVDILTSALHVDTIGLFIVDRSSPGYNNIIYEAEEARSTISFSHPLIERLKNDKKNWLFLKEILEEDTDQATAIATLMKSLKATLIVSSVYNNLVMGFVSVGEKKTGTAIQNKDINLMTHLINQCMLVISKFYEIEEKARVKVEKELQEIHRQQLEEKNTQLNQKNIDLEQANDQIKKQQTMLVRQERLSAMADVVAGVAHEINTPLLAITLAMNYFKEFAEKSMLFIGEERLKSDEKLHLLYRDIMEYIPLTYGSLENIRNHISNIKSFIKFQQGEIVRFDINKEIDTTLRILQFKIPSSVIVRTHLAPGLPLIEGNAADINQVLMNVIVNSIEAIPKSRRGQIEVSTGVDDIHVVITIIDDGIGIEEKHLNKLFIEKFSTKKITGIGLGLPLSKEIIDQHHGSITINQNEPSGVTCVIQIPFVQK